MQHTTTSAAAHIDGVLRASRLDPATITQSQLAYQKYAALQAGQPAGWHGPSDIVTLIGLGGEFFWSEDWIRPARMQFTFDAGHEGSQGTYRLSSLAGIEEGQFFSVPNNPAIGWAFIGLLPDSGTSRGFTVAGMMTDSAWKISILMLNKMGPSGPINPPFSALRML
ncbi:MAG TPA: hypothetical protein VF169_20225 [Albitalea sp.]|uniref:hypothetical protein n=1 Tax=Piscinibacter sp. TaxID=1903157 RepID=UPI002ED582DD